MQLGIGLVRDPHQTLTGIAQRVGYDSVYSFSKAYKKWVGVSPGKFRDWQFNHDPLQASGAVA